MKPAQGGNLAPMLQGEHMKKMWRKHVGENKAPVCSMHIISAKHIYSCISTTENKSNNFL